MVECERARLGRETPAGGGGQMRTARTSRASVWPTKPAATGSAAPVASRRPRPRMWLCAATRCSRPPAAFTSDTFMLASSRARQHARAAGSSDNVCAALRCEATTSKSAERRAPRQRSSRRRSRRRSRSRSRTRRSRSRRRRSSSRRRRALRRRPAKSAAAHADLVHRYHVMITGAAWPRWMPSR